MRPRGDQVAILFLNTLGARSKWVGQRDQIEHRGLGEINREIFISTHRCRCTQALERSEIRIRCTIVVSVSLCPVVAERSRRTSFQDALSSTPCCRKGEPQVILAGQTVQHALLWQRDTTGHPWRAHCAVRPVVVCGQPRLEAPEHEWAIAVDSQLTISCQSS